MKTQSKESLDKTPGKTVIDHSLKSDVSAGSRETQLHNYQTSFKFPVFFFPCVIFSSQLSLHHHLPFSSDACGQESSSSPTVFCSLQKEIGREH